MKCTLNEILIKTVQETSWIYNLRFFSTKLNPFKTKDSVVAFSDNFTRSDIT